MEAISIRSSHSVLDSSTVLMALLFPFAGLAIVLGWEIEAAGVTVRVAAWMPSSRALAIWQVVVLDFKFLSLLCLGSGSIVSLIVGLRCEKGIEAGSKNANVVRNSVGWDCRRDLGAVGFSF